MPILGLSKLLRMMPAELTALVAQVGSTNDLANSYMQMFYVGLALDQGQFALDMQAMALARRCLYRIEGPASPSVRLLAIMGPGNMLDNTPLDLVIENTGIRLDLLFVLPDGDLPDVIPDHDIAFVAIGESDKHVGLLRRVEELVAHWPRPVLNHPASIRLCSRDNCSGLLQDVPGIVAPRTSRYKNGEQWDFDFPVTMRPVDTHGGEGLARIDDATEMARYLARVAAPEYYVAQYIDYQSVDGHFRKIRMVLIEGRPYICHLAISEHWIVHYLSAGMHLCARKREEEALRMQTFGSDFAVRYRRHIESIAQKLKLDYVTIDCAELTDGRLLIFEVDSRGLVHAQDSAELYPYKLPVMQKVFDALEAMLLRRCLKS